MEKLKFGIQIMFLLLAFPVWFVAEVKQADREMKKAQLEKPSTIEIKKTVSTDKTKDADISGMMTIPFSKLMFTNS